MTEIDRVMNGEIPVPGFEFRVNPEYRDLLPPLSEDEFQGLEADLKRNGGCREPVIIGSPSGYLLDGHNRLKICQTYGLELGIPFEQEIEDGADEKVWILHNQLGRRNLDASQKGMLAAREKGLRKQFENEARERQAHGQTAPGKTLVQNPAQAFQPRSREKLAKVYGISHFTVDKAAQVFESGNSDLIAAVDTGKMAVQNAADIIGQSPEAIQEIIAKPKKDQRQAIRELKEVQASNGEKSPPSKRQLILGNAAKDRMIRILSQSRGLCRGLAELNIDSIRRSCSTEELTEWARAARESAKQLRTFADAVKTAIETE